MLLTCNIASLSMIWQCLLSLKHPIYTHRCGPVIGYLGTGSTSHWNHSRNKLWQGEEKKNKHNWGKIPRMGCREVSSLIPLACQLCSFWKKSSARGHQRGCHCPPTFVLLFNASLRNPDSRKCSALPFNYKCSTAPIPFKTVYFMLHFVPAILN